MKNTNWLLFLLLTVPFAVLAQTTNTPPVTPPVPVPGSGMGLLLTLIPLAVPLLVAAAKAGIGKLPTWTLPVLATGLGAGLNAILSLSGQAHTTVLGGALLGAAGVGIREVYDQIKGTVQTQAPPPITST